MNEEEPNLLAHLRAVRLTHGDSEGISTIILCVKLRQESDSAAALELHRKIVEEEVNNENVNVKADSPSPITGIAMAQGNSILHLLEGPCSSVLRILNNLSESDHFAAAYPIQTGRIIYDVEDRPMRYFPDWFSFSIQEKKSSVEEVSEDTCIYVVHELAMKLLEVGKLLSSEASGDVELIKYAELLPGKNLILSLSNSSLFFSVEEFVEVYSDPLNLELESETTWPLERLVQYN